MLPSSAYVSMYAAELASAITWHNPSVTATRVVVLLGNQDHPDQFHYDMHVSNLPRFNAFTPRFMHGNLLCCESGLVRGFGEEG